jgi:hypothetical protein
MEKDGGAALASYQVRTRRSLMLVQGSPGPSNEIRISYAEGAIHADRFGFAIPASVGNAAVPNVAAAGSFAPAPIETAKKKGRWSLSKLLIGNCPEFAESFAH